MLFVLLDFSPIKPDFGLFFWTVLIFLIFWFLMGKMAFGPIKDALKKRENDIQDALEESKKAREEMANMKSENAKMQAQANEDRAKILQEAKDMKNSIINEAKEKAKEEDNKIVANAKIEIDNQRKAAVNDIKNQAGVMAIEIAESLIKKNLKGDAEQEDLVNTLVDKFNLN